jgi:hypothetical protein
MRHGLATHLFATSPASVRSLSRNALSIPAPTQGFPGWMQLTALHKAGERKDEEGRRVYALLKSVADRLDHSGAATGKSLVVSGFSRTDVTRMRILPNKRRTGARTLPVPERVHIQRDAP